MQNYTVVAGMYLDELIKLVNEKIKEGYTPIGGVCTSSGTSVFYQAMLKPASPKNEESDVPDYAKTGIRSI